MLRPLRCAGPAAAGREQWLPFLVPAGQAGTDLSLMECGLSASQGYGRVGPLSSPSLIFKGAANVSLSPGLSWRGWGGRRCP